MKYSLKPAFKVPKRLRKALRRGARVEREHTRSARAARVIASHHLKEFGSRYYPALAKMEARLKKIIIRKNPRNNNSGWEFKQRYYTNLLHEAVDNDMGKHVSREKIEDMIEGAFEKALAHLQKSMNKIIAVKDYPAIRAEVTLGMAKFVHEGGGRPPGPRLRRNPMPTLQGSPKQIEWAERVYAEAEPHIRRWAAETSGEDAKALLNSLTIYDAKFWIDSRTCSSPAAFLTRAKAWFSDYWAKIKSQEVSEHSKEYVAARARGRYIAAGGKPWMSRYR